jgi:hypothetical protein
MPKGRHRPWWVDRGVYGALRDGWVTLWRVGWTGVPQAVVRFPADGRSGRDLLNHAEVYAMALLDKGTQRKVEGVEGEGIIDLEWSSAYPMLFAHLTQRVWPDGTARHTSNLTIFTDGGSIKAVLKDRDAGLCLWAASKTISGLFGVVEALLCDPEAEWRQDRQVAGQQATRVKRRTG